MARPRVAQKKKKKKKKRERETFYNNNNNNYVIYKHGRHFIETRFGQVFSGAYQFLLQGWSLWNARVCIHILLNQTITNN